MWSSVSPHPTVNMLKLSFELHALKTEWLIHCTVLHLKYIVTLNWTDYSTSPFSGAFISVLTQKPNTWGSFTLRARSCRGLPGGFNTHWKCLQVLLTTRLSLRSQQIWQVRRMYSVCQVNKPERRVLSRVWEQRLHETGNPGIVSPLCWVSHLDIYSLKIQSDLYFCAKILLYSFLHTLCSYSVSYACDKTNFDKCRSPFAWHPFCCLLLIAGLSPWHLLSP